MFNLDTYYRLLENPKPGWRLIILEETGSTNDYLAQRLGDPDAENLLILAERQTAGKGRLGREWISPPGVNLAFSLAVKAPETAPSVITLAAGVALAEAVAEVAGAEPQLKYPNDLIMNGKKAGGILSELKKSPAGEFVVVGVGVNVNPAPEAFPEELKGMVTSVAEACGVETVSREAVLAIFVNRFGHWTDSMRSGGAKDMLKIYETFALPFFGRKVAVAGGENISGVAVGLDGAGGLIIETAPGVTKTVTSGEMIFD